MALTNKEKEANRDKEKQKQQQHEYYLRVTKVKRQQARAVKEKVEITEPYEFVHKCPVCNKEWTEMTLSVKPQYSKTCAECKVIKAREYTHTEEYRKARREKAFARYHEDEKYRKKVLKKQHKYERKKDVKLRKKEQWAASKKITYMWYNKNKLLHSTKYITGGKTGFTEIARRTLVTTATKDNLNLVIVTLNDGNDFKNHLDLYESTFKKYKSYKILKKNL